MGGARRWSAELQLLVESNQALKWKRMSEALEQSEGSTVRLVNVVSALDS